MLQPFSWGQFLVASTVLNLVWYVFVLLVFYRREVNAFVGGGGGYPDSNSGGLNKPENSTLSQNSDNEIEKEVDAALMGESRLPDEVEVKSSLQVAFAGSDVDGRYDQVGLVADVV